MQNNFDINKLSVETQDLYYNSMHEYKGIIENLFNPSDSEINDKERPMPKYAKGTLDKHVFQMGMPLQEKPRRLVNAILSGNYRFVEIEGGVRGSKDIYALLAWARYLMVCPDKIHLALGSSLEHVIRTVLMSSGFGLYFLIPHGVFVRETIDGAQRGVYKFLDNYGLEKNILFYGNEKENDKNKFQGFTLGSVYVNETLNQHVAGLIEANNRMASVSQPLMIMTQNPKGTAHPFYMRFEKPKLASLSDIIRMEYVRDNFKEEFEAYEKAVLKDRDKEKKEIINETLKKFSKLKISELPLKQQIYLNEILLRVNYEFDKLIRNKTVQDFLPDFVESETDYLCNKSMKKIVNFTRGGENPNNVKNAYDFYYEHFTIDDNLATSQMQKNDFKNTFSKGTSAYDQSVRGLRRSTDSAVFSMFKTGLYPNGNLFNDEYAEQHIDTSKTMRIMALDKGLNHPNGIVDVEIDFEKGAVYQFEEDLMDFKQSDIENLGVESIYQSVLEVVRRRSDRRMPIAILVDPSAIETYIYLKEKGLPVVKANNSVFKIRGEENTESNKTQDKELIGLPLMQTAIAKYKFLVHEKNTFTIEQIGSYELIPDDKNGKEKVRKVNDDLVDPLRYIFNYYIRMSMWEGGNTSVEKDERKTIQSDDSTKRETEIEKTARERIIDTFGSQFPQLTESEYGNENEFESFFGDDSNNEFW